MQGAHSRVFASKGDLIGCTRGSARRTRLGFDGTGCLESHSGCVGVDRAAVAGRFVAFNTFQCCAYGDAFFSLTVRDLRSGRRRLAFNAGRIAVERATLLGVVVRRTGTAAWVMSRAPQADGSAATIEVRRSPGCGPTLLDRGSGIVPRSLRRTGTRVTWRRGVVRLSAALC